MSSPATPGQYRQAKKLAEALAKHRIDKAVLARQMAGPGASPAQVKSRKTQLTKWLKARHGIGDENAEAIATAFNALLGRVEYQHDYFKNPDLPKTYAEAVIEIERLRAIIGE